jgi:D-inositol-3-phosphate glycosyltransferase
MNVLGNLAIFSLHTCPLASSEGKQTGGLNVYILETAKELGKIGYKVDMFTRSQNKKEPHIVQVSPNVRLIHLIVGPEKPIPKKLLLPYVQSFAKAFLVFSSKEGSSYDLLHCHYYLSGLAGLIVKRKLKSPLILSFHTLALMKNLVSKTDDEKGESLRLKAEFELVHEADFVVASSDNDAAYLRYLYDCPAEKIQVVSPGVDTHLFFPMPKGIARKDVGVKSNIRLILAVGRIEPLKGFDSLLYALKILLVRCPELREHVCLWIVGGDTSEPVGLWPVELRHLEKLRINLGIEASVKFVGQKSQKELHSYYSAADIVVMPSHYESFGMVALEAMACGTPVIISDVSGVSDLIDSHRAGLVTTVNNPLLLAEQIEYLEFNKNEHSNYQRKVKNVSIKYSWRKSAQGLQKVYIDTIRRLNRIFFG